MLERLKMNEAPNEYIFMKILEEVKDRYEFAAIHPSVLSSIAAYMNQRVDEEIHRGEFRTSFITPNNRVVSFVEIRVFQSEQDPQILNFTPLWVYEDEEED